MRTNRDRIRHAISFEIIGILLAIPLGSLGFGMHAGDIGVVTIAAATIATVWNYFYNILFDRAMLRIKGKVIKNMFERVVHSVLFELGLLIATLPLIALYLGVSLWQALLMDLAFVLFYLVYAFIFNFVYDLVFPVSDIDDYQPAEQ
ncbi:PACE efflux transporter [Aliiroseovarius sp. F47248L]|uniref:PACE efflux transporter n=1 Tax=Aliiroseovarius sp. F47248L TaxID=2926420 RepID=UPI001FF3C194|nr:PACE efflux transporter [Aliiroseovarius sp. F47248L]MCK0138987.1 PACE efflux transporter [Aliiroseovarius sp. F47248L]